MEYISSKNICLLIRDILKLTDRRVMDHGSCVAYIVYRMLEETDMFEEYEMAELTFIASMHNIGAYRTDDISDLLKFDYADFMPHSIYGYLFLKHLFPVNAYAKILLYHHMDYKRMESVTYEFQFMSDFIHIADRVQMHRMKDGGQFDYRKFKKYVNHKFSERSFAYLCSADQRLKIFERLESGAYKEELDALMDYTMFTNEEKRKYMELLMYCGGLRNENSVVDAVKCVCICGEIGKKLRLTPEQQEILYYGALIHDIGMLTIPQEIVSAPRKLTLKEIKLLRTHVETEEKLLRKRFNNQEIVNIAVRHHERLDGTGYPNHLEGTQLTKLDRILQAADTVCGLSGRRAYRKPASKEQILSVLQEEARRNRLDSEVVKAFAASYDQIMGKTRTETEKILITYNKIRKQYESALPRFR